jgi:Amt family ammonium transporter
MLFRMRRKIDESLDVWAIHGIGGTWGTLATGLFASASVNGVNGLFFGDGMQILKQLAGVAAVWAYAFGMTWGLGKLVDVIMGLRVNEAEEAVGLDISQHGERAYGGQ